MRRAILTFLSLMSVCLSVSAQGRVMDYVGYDVSNGLSSNTVNEVLQDNIGYMWFGTYSGLDRFDGVSFHHYDLPSVTTLLEDKDRDLWIGTANGLYVFPENREKIQRFDVETDYDVLISSAINDIKSDPSGNLWIATEGQGVFLYDKITRKLSQFSRYISIVSSIDVLDEDEILVCAEAGRIMKLSMDGSTEQLFALDFSYSDRREPKVNDIYRSGSRIWIALDRSYLISVDSEFTDKKVYVDSDMTGVTEILDYDENYKIVGASSGLYLYDIDSDESDQIILADKNTAFSHHVTSVYRDKENGIWVGTKGRGVYYIPKQTKKVIFHELYDESDNKIPYSVTCFDSDDSGNIWIGTQEGGIFLLGKDWNPEPVNSSILNVQTILAIDDIVLIGTSTDGLYVIGKDGRTRNYRYDRYDTQSIMSNNVTSLYRSDDGVIWVGTEWGLCRFSLRRGIFSPASGDVGKTNVSDIHEDRNSNLWISTSSGGVFRTGPRRAAWTRYLSVGGGSPMGKVSCLFEDYSGKIWAGTANGMFFFDKEKNGFIQQDIPFPDGGRNSMVSSIRQGADGTLWISGNFGIINYDVLSSDVELYLVSNDEFPDNIFNPDCSFIRNDGTMLFGGTNGYCAFNPEQFIRNVYSARVVVSEIIVDGIPVGGVHASSDAATLELDNDQNNISFHYSLLSLHDPHKNRYYYMLEGWDADWTFIGDEAFVEYENLPSGAYCFKVRGKNSDGIPGMNEASVSFVIKVPYYLSWGAILLYVIAFTSACVIIYAYRKRKKVRMAFESKLHSYAKFAEDVREPVTLIKTPLQNMLSSYDLPNHVRADLEMMQRSAENLLGTIDQLLEYSDNNQSFADLEYSSADVVTYLEEVILRFRPMADSRRIIFETQIPDMPAVYKFDTNAMLKIFSNIFSNAVKYAESLINISLDAASDHFRVIISNDGPRIPASEQEKIFGMFYQAESTNTGTGVGLSLARILAEKHGGTLRILPTDQGASFELYMPLVRLGQTDDLLEPQITEAKETIMVLDGNHEIRRMMSSILSPYYKLILASSGGMGLELLESNIVNVIICDVAMSDMSGFDFCEIIRKDQRFTDIPLIFITSKVNVKDKVRGLEIGADDYIEKPFDSEWLKARIRSLLASRNRLKDFYKGLPGVNPLSVAPLTNADMDFINKLTNVIYENIGDENFYVDNLADAMFLSKSSLYRRVKSLLDVSPLDYIKKVRLHKAAEMLSKGEFAVFEVWQKVGFSSLAYFATCFRKEFGITPSKYAASQKDLSTEE